MTSFDMPNIVSLWLFREPEDPADAGKDVLKDFCGVDYYDLDQQEGMVREAPAGIHSLLEPLSYSVSFLDEALAGAGRLGITEAYGVLAQFDFAYNPVEVTRPVAHDPIFLGCFQWHE
jgi:hypothetical protein